MRLFDVAEAVAFTDHTVAVTGSNEVCGVVNFLPLIDRGGWFTPLRDGETFAATMVLLPEGAGLTWPDGDRPLSLRRLAFRTGWRLPAPRRRRDCPGGHGVSLVPHGTRAHEAGHVRVGQCGSAKISL